MNRVHAPAPLAGEPATSEQFALDVAYYLAQTPRQLPSRYLYDALGSALFEAICHLPWYGITRAEKRLLVTHGGEALRSVAPLSSIVELGPGNGEKLRILLEQYQGSPDALDVHLVDISVAALDSAAHALMSAAPFRLSAHHMRYEDGLRSAARYFDQDGCALVLLLGSNIGNYDPPAANALLHAIRRELRAGDALLLGADLVKAPADLVRAYDDPLGVTAAFNRNLLVRINHELGGDFEIARFEHLARWNPHESRIEMHLVSRAVQDVHIPAAGLSFTLERGERIWTESSYKYRSTGIAEMLHQNGFEVIGQWIDAPAQFALTLGRVG